MIQFPLIDGPTKDDHLPSNNPEIYYLPQKPFLSDNGSLRQLIASPSQPNNSIAEPQWIVGKLNRYSNL